MSPLLLLVTGSRALDDGAGCERWAKSQLIQVISNMPPEGIVMHGGARGPDRWAGELARTYGYQEVIFLPTGAIFGGRKPTWRNVVGDRELVAEDFLLRNKAMVMAVRDYSQRFGPVKVLGLRLPGARTNGTLRVSGPWSRTGCIDCPRTVGREHPVPVVPAPDAAERVRGSALLSVRGVSVVASGASWVLRDGGRGMGQYDRGSDAADIEDDG
jgi:hypothetical protein